MLDSHFGAIDVRGCVAELRAHGAATIRDFINPAGRAAVLMDLCFAAWTDRTGTVGKPGAEVTMDYVETRDFTGANALISVGRATSCLLATAFNHYTPRLFPEPLQFNQSIAQRYRSGSKGVTAHRDGKSCRNLVAVLVLGGEARFCTCSDRAGNNPHEVRNRPGDLVLLRAPGFDDEDVQPFHFVDNVTSRRMSLGLRHVIASA